ncbi:hypothetical protein ACWD4P_35290 [Kitasatospora sp. NPDC002543]
MSGPRRGLRRLLGPTALAVLLATGGLGGGGQAFAGTPVCDPSRLTAYTSGGLWWGQYQDGISVNASSSATLHTRAALSRTVETSVTVSGEFTASIDTLIAESSVKVGLSLSGKTAWTTSHEIQLDVPPKSTVFWRSGAVQATVNVTETYVRSNCSTRVTTGSFSAGKLVDVVVDKPSPEYDILRRGGVLENLIGGGGSSGGRPPHHPRRPDQGTPGRSSQKPTEPQPITSVVGLPDNTQLIATDTGRVYKMVGGAPVWQATCDDGICQPTSRPTTQAVIDAGPATPRDGSSAVDQRGNVYLFVGGAPLHQDTCAAPLSCGNPVKVSNWSIDARDHMNDQPADGHLVQGWDGGTGLPVAETVGGAIVPFNNPQEVIDTGYGTDWRTKVTALSARSYNSIGFVLADGTLIQGAGGAATPVAVMIGGARVNVANAQELQDIGITGDWASRVRAIPTRAFNQIPADIPRDGTLVQGAGASPTPVAHIVGGARVNFGSPQDVIDAGYGQDWATKVKVIPSRAFSLIPEHQPTTRGPLHGQLTRYSGPGRHLATTALPPDGYRLEGPLGQLLLARQPGTHPLYDCWYGGGQFTSLDAKCEGQHVDGLLGWLYDNPPAGERSMAVYRCQVPVVGDHFDSTDPNCEGKQVEGLQGYTLAYADLARYVSNSGVGHVVTAFGPPDGYRLEATLGLVNLNEPAGTVSLYDCRAGDTDYFSSLKPDCEGKTRLGGSGSLWPSPPDGIPSVAVYRCRVLNDGGHLDSTDPACEGQEKEGLLGYARAPLYSGGTGKADLVSADANGDLRQFGNIDALAFNWAPAQVVKNV